MIAQSRLIRLQCGLLLAAVGLMVLYSAVFLPLAHQADELDKPLLAAWTNLVAETRGQAVIRGLEEEAIRATRDEVEHTLTLVRDASERARYRIRLTPELRDKLNAPFQLVEFDKTRLQVISDLRRLAESNKVALADAALNGFPEYTFAEANPSLLWAQLSVANQVVACALAHRPTAITSLAMLPRQSHPGADPEVAGLEELRVRIELHGPANAMTSFLASLPLRAEELKALERPEVLGKEQPLFIDRFILKNSTNALNHASLDLVATGFVSVN